MPCILSIVNVKLTGVFSFCDLSNFTRRHVDNILSRPLTSIIKGPEYVVTRNLPILPRLMWIFDADHPSFFSNQVVPSCMGLLIKGRGCFAHTEIGGGASLAIKNKGMKDWRPST